MTDLEKLENETDPEQMLGDLKDCQLCDAPIAPCYCFGDDHEECSGYLHTQIPSNGDPHWAVPA